MDQDDARRYRRQAEECRAEASKARSPIDAASWMRLADDFDKLADAKLWGRALDLRLDWIGRGKDVNEAAN